MKKGYLSWLTLPDHSKSMTTARHNQDVPITKVSMAEVVIMEEVQHFFAFLLEWFHLSGIVLTVITK